VPVTATLRVVLGHLWAVYVLEIPVEEVIARDTGPPVGGHGVLEPLDDYVNDEIGVEAQVDRHVLPDEVAEGGTVRRPSTTEVQAERK
jgi:hypothetical protein